MDKKLQDAFPKITENNCLSIISKNKFEIYDSEEEHKCFISDINDDLHGFTVINPNNEAIRFLAIDKCLYADRDELKRCDCIIYHKKYFCFIELKNVKLKKKYSARKKAKEQLLSIIKKFREKIDFEDMTLEAYMCVGKKKLYPKERASLQSAQVEFSDLKIKLYDECQKKFDD